MKRLFFIIICLSLSVFSSFSQEAKDILDKAAEAFQNAGNTSISFVVNIQDKNQGASESFEGKIDLQGEKFHLDTPDLESWFDGTSQWTLQKEWDEVTISNPSKEDVRMLNPNMVFDLYKTGSNAKYIGRKTDIKNRDVYEIELNPKNDKGDIVRILVDISTKSYFIFKIEIEFKNGVKNIFYIDKYVIKTNFLSDHFVFKNDNYPDVEVIDLRNNE
ncbi:hypothetical protein LJB98_01300 [Bacteroidales bacterium OttesenSCG-928-M11]|nr:hypothetical protein [Bacteroidales bacterium OttesenSCG-928-M11]